MSGAGPGWALLLVGFIAANLPFLTDRIEARLGQRAPQGWEFYAAALCLMVTFAFPGFVWRILRKQQPADTAP